MFTPTPIANKVSFVVILLCLQCPFFTEAFTPIAGRPNRVPQPLPLPSDRTEADVDVVIPHGLNRKVLSNARGKCVFDDVEDEQSHTVVFEEKRVMKKFWSWVRVEFSQTTLLRWGSHMFERDLIKSTFPISDSLYARWNSLFFVS